MKKKILSKILNLWRKPIVKVICYLFVLVLIFVISGAINNQEGENKNLLQFIKEVLTQPETISFFAAGIFTIVIATIVTSTEKRLEETLKIEADHHKIIAQ